MHAFAPALAAVGQENVKPSGCEPQGFHRLAHALMRTQLLDSEMLDLLAMSFSPTSMLCGGSPFAGGGLPQTMPAATSAGPPPPVMMGHDAVHALPLLPGRGT